jgi:predicted kinase
MPTIHLIYGFLGAGKTTFAKSLEQETGSVRFSPDEWMVRLHGTNPPADRFPEQEERVAELIWDMAALFLKRGHDVIMDMGFWNRAHRDYAREFARENKAEVKLYALTCREDTMRRRVLERTRTLPDRALFIDENAFELFKDRFEPLGSDEEHIAIDTSVP